MTIQATTEQINNTNLNSILSEKTYQEKFRSKFIPTFNYKGALSRIDGYFAMKHRLFGGGIIENIPQKKIAEETNYNIKTVNRIIKKMVELGTLILIKTESTGRNLWINSYIYLPAGIDTQALFKQIKDECGIDLSVSNSETPLGQNVLESRTKCPRDTSSILENFLEVKEPPGKSPPNQPQNQPSKIDRTGVDCLKKIDRIREHLPKKCWYQIKTKFIEQAIDKFGFNYILWAAKESKSKSDPKNYFCKAIYDREIFNKYDRKITKEGEKNEIEKQRRALKEAKTAIAEFKKMTEEEGIKIEKMHPDAEKEITMQEKIAYARNNLPVLRAKFIEKYCHDETTTNYIKYMDDEKLIIYPSFERFIYEIEAMVK